MSLTKVVTIKIRPQCQFIVCNLRLIIIIIIIHGIVTLLGLTGGESPQQVTHLPPVWDLLLALA